MARLSSRAAFWRLCKMADWMRLASRPRSLDVQLRSAFELVPERVMDAPSLLVAGRVEGNDAAFPVTCERFEKGKLILFHRVVPLHGSPRKMCDGLLQQSGRYSL